MHTQSKELRDLPLELIRLAAQYSAVSYSGFPKVERISSWWTSAEAYVIQSDETQILVFVGSVQPLDWLINLAAIPVPYGRLSHLGFSLSHYSVWGRVKKKLDKSKPVLVTGHSQGGANAEKSAEFMTDFADVSLITFGKPNLYVKGNQPKLKHVRNRISVVSGSDIVTRMPRYAYGPSVGQTMLYLANDDNDYIDPPREFLVSDWSIKDSISDHNMLDLYLARINRAIDRLSNAA